MNDSLALLNGDLIEPSEVHQAAGMLTAQLGISITDAIACLRAHAATTRRPLVDVAQDVIGGRLRLPGPPNRAA